MVRKACKLCKRILKGTVCPACKSNQSTSSFQGTVIIFDTESEIAKKLAIAEPGKYAVRV